MRGFLGSHRQILSSRWCENIKRSRAGVNSDSINSYFDELEKSLDGIEPHLIVNFDETNISDDPGKSKVIARRGSKHAHRIVDSSKTSHSVMFAGSASGTLLPIYIVYKAENLYASWTSGGPLELGITEVNLGGLTRLFLKTGSLQLLLNILKNFQPRARKL